MLRHGSFGLPSWFLDFERKYDKETGGWRFGATVEYGSVELEVGRLLYSLVLLNRPRNVLETGTFRGYSASCISLALAELGGDRVLYTIDPNPAEQIWKDSFLERYIRPIRDTSKNAASLFASIALDMILLDSDHSYETIVGEVNLYEPKLALGGIMLLHDSIFFDSVAKALKELLSSGRFECVTLETPRHHHSKTARSPGFSILKKIAVGESE